MRFLLLVFSLVLLLSGCGKPTQAPGSGDAKRYQVVGKVVAVDRAAKKATIKHEDIQGYMPGMTMEFPVRADWVWDDLTKDCEIHADLVIDKDQFWLENIGIVAVPNPDQKAPQIDDRFIQIGNEIPDFSLVNQDGKKISIKDFHGRALAITFIYTRCPLPDYCIKMSTQFSDASKEIAASPYADKMRLLSISFDPKNDTPKVLRDYGLGYMRGQEKPDFTVWSLATGTEKEIGDIAKYFGLQYEADKDNRAQINHSLRTIVIAPDGKVLKIFPGNSWSTPQLLEIMKSSVDQPS
jgi:protein SCO1